MSIRHPHGAAGLRGSRGTDESRLHERDLPATFVDDLEALHYPKIRGIPLKPAIFPNRPKCLTNRVIDSALELLLTD
jgi:hypothetical protein